jgi:hypothetical protein
VRPDFIEQDWSGLGKGIQEGGALAEVWQVWGAKIGVFFGF